MTIPGDITDEAHCVRMVADVIDQFGGLDILVNNAAFQSTHEGPVERGVVGQFLLRKPLDLSGFTDACADLLK